MGAWALTHCTGGGGRTQQFLGQSVSRLPNKNINITKCEQINTDVRTVELITVMDSFPLSIP